MILASWLVWLVPLIAVPVAALVGTLREKAIGWFATAVTALTAVLGIYQAAAFSQNTAEGIEGSTIPILNISLEVRADGLSVLLVAFVSFLSFLIVFYSVEYMKRERGLTRFYSLTLLFIGAMLGLLMAGNIVQLYFFWEIVGICSALLIAFYIDRESARRAGLKAFVVTRIGDAALLAGVLLTLVTFHSGNFGIVLGGVSSPTTSKSVVLVIGILIFVGAMGKSAQVPLHVWLPDAMEGPTPVSALIHAATMVNAGVYLVARMFPLFQTSTVLLSIVLVVGALSMIVGGVCAAAAQDIKRILAYSTISQLGLMFVALGLGSLQGSVYQLVSQGLFKALAFLAAGAVAQAIGTRNIAEMGGLRRAMKYTYISFLFAVLAMVGTPPLVGFWSKEIIATTAGGTIAVELTILASTAITAIYSFRALFRVFHGKPREGRVVKETSIIMRIPMLVLCASLILGWLLFNYQNILPLWNSLAINAQTIVYSMGVVGVALGLAYVGYLAKREQTEKLIERTPLFKSTLAALAVGLGFDSLYALIYRRVLLPATRGARALETGYLGINEAFLFVVLIIVIILFSIGVI